MKSSMSSRSGTGRGDVVSSPGTACCASKDHGRVVAEIPNRELADEAPSTIVRTPSRCGARRCKVPSSRAGF